MSIRLVSTKNENDYVDLPLSLLNKYTREYGENLIYIIIDELPRLYNENILLSVTNVKDIYDYFNNGGAWNHNAKIRVINGKKRNLNEVSEYLLVRNIILPLISKKKIMKKKKNEEIAKEEIMQDEYDSSEEQFKREMREAELEGDVLHDKDFLYEDDFLHENDNPY